MTTTVVHINHPDGFDLYIGRATPRARNTAAWVESPWANPFPLSQGGRPAALDRFHRGLRKGDLTPADFAWMREHLPDLADLRLACWCAQPQTLVLTSAQPWVCHGQILAWYTEHPDKL
jgi:hypothetical protein